MKPILPDQLTPQSRNREPASWLFTYAVVAFVIAVVVIGICAIRLITHSNSFLAGDELFAFAILLQTTIGHSLFNLFLTVSLLILKRWRSAAVVLALGLTAASPLAMLFISE
ncbi:hypothetical protein [Botrimarina mediterranea]|uniref:hypothetical protein n=1 Tax=Botrimarina mediterranea TaxID=2528022 RepID=UPI0011A9B11B|nr:hypothetical protein [Botrimarina mediterranea]